MAEATESFQQWAILELMGHVRLAGIVTEEERFGIKMGRIDIPNQDGFTTQYFGGSSVYRLTPTTEEIARGVATRNQPTPVHRWELPAASIPTNEVQQFGTDYDRDDDDDLPVRNDDDDLHF